MPTSRRGDRVPRVPVLRERARRRSHLLAPRLVCEQRLDRIDERRLVSGRERRGRLWRHDVTVPRDVGRHDRRGTRERARQHHAEALAAERRRDERLRRQQLLGEPVLVEEAEHLDPVVGQPQARHQQPDAKRIGADHAQARARAPADLRPRVQEHVQPLPRLVAAGEDEPVLASGRVRLLRDQHAVRDDLVVARIASAARTPSPSRRPRCDSRYGRRGIPTRASRSSSS